MIRFIATGAVICVAVAAVAVVLSGGDSAAVCSSDVVIHDQWARHRVTILTEDYQPTRRQELAPDLVECRRFEGVSKREAIELLGRPDQDDGDWLYWDLGPDNDLPLNRESLELRLGDGRHVSEVGIRSGG